MIILLVPTIIFMGATFSGSQPQNLRADATPFSGSKRNSVKMNAVSSSVGEATLNIPHLLYGTAWKKERTQDLVVKAVKNGFRGIICVFNNDESYFVLDRFSVCFSKVSML